MILVCKFQVFRWEMIKDRCLIRGLLKRTYCFCAVLGTLEVSMKPGAEVSYSIKIWIYFINIFVVRNIWNICSYDFMYIFLCIYFLCIFGYFYVKWNVFKFCDTFETTLIARAKECEWVGRTVPLFDEFLLYTFKKCYLTRNKFLDTFIDEFLSGTSKKLENRFAKQI